MKVQLNTPSQLLIRDLTSGVLNLMTIFVPLTRLTFRRWRKQRCCSCWRRRCLQCRNTGTYDRCKWSAHSV